MIVKVEMTELDARLIADVLLGCARSKFASADQRHELQRLACKFERALAGKPDPKEPLVSLAEMVRKPDVKDW
jgi:hypothetical protein